MLATVLKLLNIAVLVTALGIISYTWAANCTFMTSAACVTWGIGNPDYPGYCCDGGTNPNNKFGTACQKDQTPGLDYAGFQCGFLKEIVNGQCMFNVGECGGEVVTANCQAVKCT
jgi:hypothetical protein